MLANALTTDPNFRAVNDGMKKTPLFEYEVPTYRKRPTEWFETQDKPTR